MGVDGTFSGGSGHVGGHKREPGRAGAHGGGKGGVASEDLSDDIRGDAAAQVLEMLVERGQTIAAAESLTGGMLAAELTAAPGASRAFRGSVTAYATEVKHHVLGVDADLLHEHGAVDAEVARQMAAGVRRVLGADWGVATTGVAGPEPQDGQPVGTVYVAVAGPRGPKDPQPGAPMALRLRLDGDRLAIREGSVAAALQLLFGELIENMRAKDTEHSGGNGCLQP